jgi:pyruvate,water dikinase
MEAPPTVFKADKADAAFLLRLPGTVWAMIRSSRRMNRMRGRALERFQEEILPPYLDYVKRKRAQDLSGLPVADLIAELKDRCVKVMDAFGNESLKPGFFGGMARAALEANLTQLMGEDEGTKLALNLTMGLDGDITIEQNAFLYKVAQGEKTLESFLGKYGHRTVGEMELSEPRWHEDPAYLEKQMAALKGAGTKSPEELHHANAEKRKEAEEALPKVLAEWGGSCFREEIQAELEDAQKLLPFRENGKHYLMMGYDLIRRAIVEMSNRWDLGRDIFFLKWDELPRYEQEKDALNERIAKRKVRWNSARRLEMPDVVDSKDLGDLGKPRVFEAASELEGDPIAAGVYTGIARIVHDPNEDRDLGAEFVLVCPSTDPGWTALFVNTKGLIIERGGILSHGAIVARDFGIPAVVRSDATRRIKDGQKVRVDGNRGLITIVE